MYAARYEQKVSYRIWRIQRRPDITFKEIFMKNHKKIELGLQPSHLDSSDMGNPTPSCHGILINIFVMNQ